MKSVFLWLIMSGICVAQAGTAEDILSLEVKIKPEKFTAGEPLYLEYTLKNEGTNPVYIISTKGSYHFYVKDYTSNQVIMPGTIHNRLEFVDKVSYVLIKPSECYEYTYHKPLIINQSSNGSYRLESGSFRCPVNKSGFIIKGLFFAGDNPMDDFEGLDKSVPLIKINGGLEGEVGYIFDGGFFHRQPVKSNRKEGRYKPTYTNHQEVKCARFDGQEDLVIYETDMVRIEAEKSAFMDVLNEEIRSDEYPQVLHRKRNILLFDQLNRSKGSFELEGASDISSEPFKEILSNQLCEEKCQVYDLSEREYIKNFIVAEWDDGGSAGLIFMFKDDSSVFYKVFTRLTIF